MMKIVIASDSYKGNLRSSRICSIIKDAIQREISDAEVLVFPMADGGEGTVEAVVTAKGGVFHTLEVEGPLGGLVTALYGLLPDGTAIIETASASGMELMPANRLNPMETTTFGIGQLIRRLLETGHTSIVTGIGGSATIDGGTGMAQALGYRFMDAAGNEITDRGGKILSHIHQIDASRVCQKLKNARIYAAYDVVNPLTGPNGAAAVFGPQKGATPEMTKQFDAGLANLCAAAGEKEAPADGSGGGLGYGLRVFCSAEMVSGAELIAETVGLPEALEGADLLITGEGRSDEQTISGKLCTALALMARKKGAKTLLISGALQGEPDMFLDLFDYAFSISTGHTSLEDCLRYAPRDMAFLTRNIIRLLQTRKGCLFRNS